jgi:hypothetical protein
VDQQRVVTASRWSIGGYRQGPTEPEAFANFDPDDLFAKVSIKLMSTTEEIETGSVYHD